VSDALRLADRDGPALQPQTYASERVLHSASLDAATERLLFDPRRFPFLSTHGRSLLRWMRGHPSAPHYRHFSGHRLDQRSIWRAHWRHALVRHGRIPQWMPGKPVPAWVQQWVAHCTAHVPAHANKAQATHWQRDIQRACTLDGIPTTDRHALSTRLAQHVPAGLPLDRVICYATSGTTGHPLRVPSHPDVACDYFAYHCRALRPFGVEPTAGRGQVGIVLAGFQQRCFTYVSVNPLRHECGVAKLNLHPGEWAHERDRAAYLDALQPELISGDPVSLAELLRIGMKHRPRALLSTSMALLPALRQELEGHFGCPVADIYSMNEAGPIGVFMPELDGFLLLQPRLLVEIVDAQGRALPWGQRGEVCITGGFNPWLPLLRYRTGDHAHLAPTALGPVLRGLEGRAPVRFRTTSGAWINNIEITHAMSAFALTRFALHQDAAGRLHLRVDAREPLALLAPALHEALAVRLGRQIELRIEALAAGDKLRQYTSDLPTALTHPQPGTGT
jgi:phenylacetate-CoA ligase